MAARKKLRPARPPNPNSKPGSSSDGPPAKRAHAEAGKAASGRGRQGGRPAGATPGSGEGGPKGGAGARGEAGRGATGRPPRGLGVGAGASWGPRGSQEGPAADGVFRAHPDGLTDDLAHGKVLMQARAASWVKQ